MHMRILDRLPELGVQDILQKAVEPHFFRILLNKSRHFAGTVHSHFAPLLKVRAAVPVAQDAEYGIRKQPVLVGLYKGLVLR